MTQYKHQRPNLMTGYHVCSHACDRAVGKACIRPEFSLSVPLIVQGWKPAWWTCSSWHSASQQKARLFAYPDWYNPRSSDEAALPSLPHSVLGGWSCGQVSPLLSLCADCCSSTWKISALSSPCCTQHPGKLPRSQQDWAAGTRQRQHEPVT